MKKHLLRLLSALLCAVMLALPASALTVDQALELLEQVYLREIPDAAYQAESLDELFRLLGDPYTYYMTAEDYQAFLDSVESTIDVVGIGVSIQYTDQGLLVVSVLDGSSAQEGGLLDGDLIVAVDGTPCVPAQEEHRNLLLGEEGSTVTVTVLRDGASRDYTLTRRPVVIPNTQVRVLEGGVGLIDCDSFGSLTGSYFADGIAQYDSLVDYWLVDLRGNPGGYTSAAGEATAVFIGPCYYLFLEDRQGMVYGYTNNDPAVTDKPVVLVLDGSSASSSEALAANIRDSNRGISIGGRTYGKGVAQIICDEEQYSAYFDGDGVKVTAYRFYSYGGNTTDQIGVIPTLLVDGPYARSAASALCGGEGAELSIQIDGQIFFVAPDTDVDVLAALFSALPPSAQTALWEDGAWVPYSISQTAAKLGLLYDTRWFIDVADSPYADEIDTLATYQLLRGVGYGRFDPERRLTRAELCAMLAQVLNVSYTGESRFSDVPASAWYFEPVNAIAKLGLVNGVGGGRFNPGALLTQEEFITIMGRTARYLNFAVNGYGKQVETMLADGSAPALLDFGALEPFAPWARTSAAVLAWGAEETLESAGSLLYAPLNRLTPSAPVLREEAAAGMYELLTGLNILPE